MKSTQWRSGTTLAVVFLFVGCGGISPGSKDASSERGRADSARDASDAGRDLGTEGGLADSRADLRNDATIFTEVGRDSAVDVTVATPDSPSGGMDAVYPVDTETLTCPADYHDGGDQVCVPTGSCSPGYHDYGTGVCVKTGCAPGYHNGGDGTCVASGVCSTGYRNGGNGTCVTDGTCLLGYHDDGAGLCIQTVCASGYHDGGDGTCVETGTCVSGYHDGGNGGCTPLGICVLGYHDSGAGTCVVTGICADGYHNAGNGTCVAAGTCTTGYHIGGGETCVAIGTCSAGYHDQGNGTCLLNSSADAAVDTPTDTALIVPVDAAPDILRDANHDASPMDAAEAGDSEGDGISSDTGDLGDGSDGSDGNDGAPACNVPADCTGTDTACTVRICVAGLCGTAPRASGNAPEAFQTAGDCHKVVCDGAGGVTSVIDNTDFLADNNACTADLCTAGVPSHPALAARTPCSGGLCNGAGVCVACLADSDCGTPTECRTPTCSAEGTCGFTDAPAGTVVATQTTGDCQKVVCDGSGGKTSVADNTDVPTDAYECTSDICTAGVPSNPLLPPGTSCSGGKCNAAGTCVACLANSDCGTPTDCRTPVCSAEGTCGYSYTPEGTLVTALPTGDCKKTVCDGGGNTTLVADDLDLPVDGKDCTDDLCTAGVPSNPPVSARTHCSGGLCNGTGVCVECLVGSDCPGTPTTCRTPVCSAGGACGFSDAPEGTVVTVEPARDCQMVVCNGGGGTTFAPDNSDLPIDGNDCTDDVCTAGAPSNPFFSFGTPCGTSGLCDGAGVCVTVH